MNPETLVSPDKFEEAARAAEDIQNRRERELGSMSAAEAVREITGLSYPLAVAEEAVAQTLGGKAQAGIVSLDDVVQIGSSIVQAQEGLRRIEDGNLSAYHESQLKKAALGFGPLAAGIAISVLCGDLIGGVIGTATGMTAMGAYEKQGPKRWARRQEAQYNAAIATLRAQFPAITTANIGDVVLYTNDRELMLGEANKIWRHDVRVAHADYTKLCNFDEHDIPFEHILCIMNEGEPQELTPAGFNALRVREPVKITRKTVVTEEVQNFIGFVGNKVPGFTGVSAALSGKHHYALQHPPGYEYTLTKLSPRI